MDELKACPFCGGKVDYIFTDHKNSKSRTHQFVCHNCGADFFLPRNDKYQSAEATEAEAVATFNCRAEPENKENQAIIQQAMQDIKYYHCGDYDCLLPENKLDDDGYWANDTACNNCTYGACYRALERSLRTTEPENKPLTLEQLRQMDGEPVWIESDVYHEHNWNIVTSCSEKSIQFASADSIIYRQNNEYGTNWLAYAHKPEHEAKP